MKNILMICFVSLSFPVAAQVKSVNLQASGLTCSMCSNSIFKALKSLDFVENVEADIKNSSFEIRFKPGAVVDFDKLKGKVEGAGFFVARFSFVYTFQNQPVSNDAHVNVGNDIFHFLNVKGSVLEGDVKVRLLNKGYVSAKEYKKNGGLTKMDCYKTGTMGGKRVFHVTI